MTIYTGAQGKYPAMKKSSYLIILFLLMAVHVPLFSQESGPVLEQDKSAETITEKHKKDNKKDQVFTAGEILVKDKKIKPGVTTTISGEEVEKSSKTDLINVINEKVPSFYTGNNRVMGFGVANSSAASMSIRGIGVSGWGGQTGSGPSTGLPILINGMDTTMMINNHPVADIFTMKNIDHIEVLHGPQPVLYGSSAMGGIINIITKRMSTEGTATKISVSWGTDSTTDDYIQHYGKSGRFDYGVSYNFRYTQGSREQTLNGTTYDSLYMNNSGTMHMGYALNRNWYFGLDGYIMKLKIHDPGPDGLTPAVMTAVSGDYTIENFLITRGGTVIQIGNTFKNIEGSLQLYWNRGHHESEIPVDNDRQKYNSDDHMYGIKLKESIKVIKGNTLTLGTEARRYGGKSENMITGYVYTDDEYINEQSLFALDEHSFLNNLFIISAGGRYTRNSEYGLYGSWQGGAILNPARATKIHVSAARGFKLPDIIQIYNKWWDGDQTIEESGTDLEPETYTCIETGIEQSFHDRVILSVTGYRIYSRNRFVREIGAGFTEWTNAQDFNYNGIEVNVNYSPVKAVLLTAGYSFIENEQDSRTIPYTPRHKVLGGISLEKYGLYIAINGEYVTDIYANEEEKTLVMKGTQYTVEHKKMDDYFVLNSKLSYRFLERYSVFVNFNNITDNRYSTVSLYLAPVVPAFTQPVEAGTNEFYNYPMPGFSILGGMSYEF